MPHINELYDYTVTVFIVNDNRVLLVHHPRYDKWIPMGGHIELDEDPEQAVYREIAEETGLHVELLTEKPALESAGTKFLPTPNYVDVHEANPPHKHISFTYFGVSADDKFVLSDEHSEMKWFTSQELEEPEYALSASVIFYATKALEKARDVEQA